MYAFSKFVKIFACFHCDLSGFTYIYIYNLFGIDFCIWYEITLKMNQLWQSHLCGRSKLCFWSLTSLHFVNEALDCSSDFTGFLRGALCLGQDSSSSCIHNQKIFSNGLAIISSPQKIYLLFGILYHHKLTTFQFYWLKHIVYFIYLSFSFVLGIIYLFDLLCKYTYGIIYVILWL